MGDTLSQQSKSQFFELKREKLQKRLDRRDFEQDLKDRALNLLKLARTPVALALTSTVTDGWDLDPARNKGQRSRAGARDRGDAIRREAKARHTAWQKEATEIWSRRCELTKIAVAGLVARKCGGNPNTIRRIIRRPE